MTTYRASISASPVRAWSLHGTTALLALYRLKVEASIETLLNIYHNNYCDRNIDYIDYYDSNVYHNHYYDIQEI